MKSSPYDVILAEANEPPLDLRRQYLAEKFVARLRACNSTLLTRLAHLNTENPFWRIKNSPPLTNAFLNTREISHDPNQLETSSLFLFRFELILFEPLIIFLKYLDLQAYNHGIVQSLIQDLNIKTTIFTDGRRDSL